MEKLTRVAVAGFRSLRSVETTLDDRSVLVGANGSGKSNFLGVFELLSSMLSGRLQLFVARNGGGAALLHYGPKVTPVLSIGLTFEGEDGRSEYSCTLAHAETDRLVFASERVAFVKDGHAEPFEALLGSGHVESSLLDLARLPDESTPRKVARLLIERLKELQPHHFHDTSESARIRMPHDVHQDRVLHSTGGNLAAFLYMLRRAFPAHYALIVSTMRIVMPYVRDLEFVPDPADPERIQLRWRDRSGEYELGSSQLSDGSLRALALVAALMQPEVLMPAVIIVDEPELGLHPSGVAMLAQLLQSAASKRQVVVATQSPSLIAAFAPEDIVVVEREEDDLGRGSSTLHRLSTAELGSWFDNYDLGQLFAMNVTGGGPQ